MDHSYIDADFIRGPSNEPLRLFHGTRHNFDRFEFEKLRSAGLHFGCEMQANYLATEEKGARVFPVFLKKIRTRRLKGI
jgi:hypothetical protein